MADEFDDAIDGRLVIATDDERMDCTESAILTREDKESGGSSVGPNASPKELSKTELDNLAAPDGSHSTEDDGKNCCKDEPHLLVSNIALNSKYIANETTESTADGLDKLQKQTELVKWEELEGGIVPPVTGSKLFENERVPRSFDFVAKGHLSNEMNKSLALPNSQHGVHNFLHGGGDSKKKKLMVDKGTCVLSRPTGTHGLDEHLLAMRPGTNLTIDITIICKAGSNTLYISAKWKGREYHGVLTDGEPLFSHTYAQKRSAAQNAEKFVFESGAGNNGGTANQKAQNSEKAGGGGMSGKRGGKRGVGGHPKGGSGEKRAKNNQIESQSGADAEDEAAKSSKSEDKMRTDSGERAAEGTELGGDRQLTEEKPLGNPHGHNQHLHQQHHRRRTSSSASSGVCVVPSKNGLYDGDAASRIRCQHKQCGHRFETANELNAHLLIGTHGVAGEKAVKIFESTASQTSSVQFVSVGCDPCFSSKVLVSNNTKSNLFCAKCQKELAPENGDNHSDEVKRPQLLECDDSVEKSKPKVVATDNSPGFSDISDDAAPTLEKEESFDKQGDEAKKVPPLSALAASSVPSSSHTPDRTDAVAAGDPSTSAHQPNACGKNVSSQSTGDNKNGIEIPSKSVAVSIIRQNLLTNANNTKNGEESAANGAIKPPTKKTSSSSIALTLAKTPTTTMATGAIGESSNDSNNNNNSSANTNPYFMTSTSEMAAANAVASGFPFNHFLSFGPHLSHQAFVSALAQGAAQIGVVPSSAPSASSLVPSSSALAAGLKLMSPPSAAGLLSLGTPLTASANQMPNCSGAPSKSAEPPAISQPIQHKIYELQQQQQSGALLGRSSSTKPSTSGVGHVQSANVGTPGAMGGGANAISSADMALMRPNSAISAVGYHSQQQLQNSQMHSAVPQVPPQQANRQCPPGAPSPIGSVGVSTAVGPFVHHLPAPPLHHPFLPPLSSLIAGAGAQFGIPAGSAAAPNILAAAAAQQQQQQMAAFRRNNNANAGQSSASTNQQQAVAAAQHHNPSLLAPFVPQGLSPGMLAMASNFDLNALQHYAAALIASAPSSDAFGNAPPSGQQQQQPTQK